MSLIPSIDISKISFSWILYTCYSNLKYFIYTLFKLRFILKQSKIWMELKCTFKYNLSQKSDNVIKLAGCIPILIVSVGAYAPANDLQ